MLKNPVFALKNPYFTTDFPNIKIIAELTNLYFKQPKKCKKYGICMNLVDKILLSLIV